MNNHASTIHTLTYEEQAMLLDEKSPSDIESGAGIADLTHRFTASPPRRIRTLLVRTCFFLLPSFIQSRIRSSSSDTITTKKPSPTTYLDGIRGLAALFVFICHLTYTCFVIAPGYGYKTTNFHILKLPLIRLFYSGPPMVAVFFVVSGFALSLRPLRLARSGQHADLAETMASFIFRRPLRLFLPPAISTFIIACLLRLGAYEWNREFAYDDVYMRNVQEIHYQRFNTTSDQMADWAWTMWRFVHVWDWDVFGGSTGMDVHLWTIPVEFRCSMGLFLALVGTSGCKTVVRTLVVAGMGVFCFLSERWEMMLFLAGMGLAEMELAWKTDKKGGVWYGVGVVGLYLMSQPDVGSEETPGWVWLCRMIPEWWSDKHRFWQSFGAIVFVLAVARSAGWQRVFNLGVVQYFGRISYAIYLMHGPVMHTVGYSIEKGMWKLTGVEGMAYNYGFVVASLFVVPVVIWASDVFWRAVDAPVVQFAKWVETKCSAN
ncbi:hypothetical protein OQA88_11267 [Cercophora sp. LCS_1]